MRKMLSFIILIFVCSLAHAETATHAQVIAAGKYERNFDCIDRSIPENYYTDCTATWTTPSTLQRTDIVHFKLVAAGAGGCPYQGVGGPGGKLDLDLTDLPGGTVFTIHVPGAGHGCGASQSGATRGGHVWVEYNDPDDSNHPLYHYSANAGRTDNAAGGGRSGQGCDNESGGCTGNPNDPHLILQSFYPDGLGDGSPANLWPDGSNGSIGTGNAGGAGGQNTPAGVGQRGFGGGAVGPGGINCTLPCNRGGQISMWGFDSNLGLVRISINAGI